MRRSALKPSRGTVIPPELRNAVIHRDQECVGRLIGLAGSCSWALEVDHVRSSGGMGMKSPTVAANLVLLCSAHHRYKTEHGREVRPLLVAYIDDAMERAEVIG